MLGTKKNSVPPEHSHGIPKHMNKQTKHREISRDTRISTQVAGTVQVQRMDGLQGVGRE